MCLHYVLVDPVISLVQTFCKHIRCSLIQYILISSVVLLPYFLLLWHISHCFQASEERGNEFSISEDAVMYLIFIGVFSGEDESHYWNKMLRDREQKLSNNVRVKQRGRDKILRRAERELGKHIKFDD